MIKIETHPTVSPLTGHGDANDTSDGNSNKSITFMRTCVPYYYIHVYARG